MLGQAARENRTVEGWTRCQCKSNSPPFFPTPSTRHCPSHLVSLFVTSRASDSTGFVTATRVKEIALAGVDDARGDTEAGSMKYSGPEVRNNGGALDGAASLCIVKGRR